MSLVRRVARPLLAAPFITAGVAHLRSPERTGNGLRPLLDKVSDVVPQAQSVAEKPELAARVLGGVQVGAGALLALGKMPRLASALIVAAQSATLLADGVPQHKDGSRALAVTTQLGLAGGALLAVVDTDGKPSLAYRTQKASKKASKKAKKQAKKAANAAGLSS